MVTIKGADQTRRDEDTSFIADFVTQKPPPPWNRRIRSLRATPPIHPLTPVLSSSTGAESICGIETSESAEKKERRRDAYVAPIPSVPETAEGGSNHNKNSTINFHLIKRRYYQLFSFLKLKSSVFSIFQFWIS